MFREDGDLKNSRTPRKRTIMDNEASKDRGWTVRRVLRAAGTSTLVISFFMALFGAYGINYTASARLFFIYWTIFVVMLMSALSIAILDILMTIARFRKGHADLRREFASRTRKTDAHDT